MMRRLPLVLTAVGLMPFFAVACDKGEAAPPAPTPAATPAAPPAATPEGLPPRPRSRRSRR